MWSVTQGMDEGSTLKHYLIDTMTLFGDPAMLLPGPATN